MHEYSSSRNMMMVPVGKRWTDVNVLVLLYMLLCLYYIVTGGQETGGGRWRLVGYPSSCFTWLANVLYSYMYSCNTAYGRTKDDWGLL